MSENNNRDLRARPDLSAPGFLRGFIRHCSRQAPPDGFEIEYIETILTPDQALERLNAADKPEYFLGPEGRSVALWGNVTRLGNGGTVTNGQVLTVTPQGNVLTTVTGDRAVSIGESGRVRVIRLQRT
jgi:hypothetical protein